jgi:anti-sigma regulatory factor (Ser/Thr protein kinase)
MTEFASAPAPVGSEVVEISIPMRTEFIATLRTVAASLGADAGFSIDEIDDLRLAISEVVSTLTDGAASTGAVDDRIDATFSVGGAQVEVTITTRRGDVPIELDELASSILNSVVDGLVVDGAALTLVKVASDAAGRQDPEHRARTT